MTAGIKAWNSAQILSSANWLQYGRIWLTLKPLNNAFLISSPSTTAVIITSLNCRLLMMTHHLMTRRQPCTRLSATTKTLHHITPVSAASSLDLLLLEAQHQHHHMACALAPTPPPSMAASLNPCPWVVFLLPAPVTPCSLKHLLAPLEPAPPTMSPCSLWRSSQTPSCSEALAHFLN